MKLIIAEKPDVAKNIAHVVGAYEKVSSGYGYASCYRGNGYYVSNAIGHLYSIGQPSDYGFSEKLWNWNIDELPMLPEKFGIYPINTSDEGLNNQRKLLKELISREDVDEIICATDAGREGELIFRYIYNESGSTKPVKRLWISSLTEEAITSGMAALKPDSEYDNKYIAGAARAKADWYVGMTLSRLYTCLDGTNRCLHRVGRVKTPVLNIVVKRDTKIKKFIKQPYWKLQLENGAECKKEFESKETAEDVRKKCVGAVATCTKAETEVKSKNRPLLHSLNSLQREANDIYGMTAAEVLGATQKLYEKKLCTYPRTDSNYLSDDMKSVVENVVECLIEYEPERVSQLKLQGLNIDGRIINNDKIGDHHAIIPTDNIKTLNLSKLTENEQRVIKLIINRFLSAVDMPYKYKETYYVFDAEYAEFELTIKIPVELGWKKYNVNPDEKFPNGEFPEYKLNETFTVENIIVKECEKAPPKHYTDGTLISAMENIDNIIDDKELKGYVSGKGLGTTATRSNIIEELISNGYIERSGKNLVATDFGIEFINSVPESIKSVERTAEWEKTLEQIENGTCGEEALLNDIRSFLIKSVESEKANTGRPQMQHTNIKPVERVSLGICPRCRKNIYEGKQNFYCESGKDGCGFTIWKKSKIFLNEVTANDVKDLLSGKTIKLKSENSDGKAYTADYELDDTGTYVNFKRVKQEKISLGACPRCGKNIYEGKQNFYCESGRDGCGFTVWKENKYLSVKISAKHMKDLLGKGKTSIAVTDLNGNKKSNEYVLEDTGKYINLKKVQQ